MPGIQISGTFKKGTLDQGSFAINKADSLLIPIQIAADIDARDAMYEYLRMPFMLVYVISENKTYRLGAGVLISNQIWTLTTEDYIPLTQKGAPSGVPPLNAEGKIPVEYLDALYLSSSYVVLDIPSMLALTTYKGNLIVVQDASADPTVSSGSATYAKINDVASPTLADFLKMEFGISVVSVNGQTGAVSIDFNNLLAYGASQTQFDTAVSNNTTVLQNAADIITLAGDIQALDNIKANKDNVLQLDNTTPYVPTADYHPSTKKYVDDQVAENSIIPLGPEGSIQINEANILNGYANFTYISDVLTVPAIKLSTSTPVDNTIDMIVVRDEATGELKFREVTSLGSGGGHLIEGQGIPFTTRKSLNFVGNLVALSDDPGNDRTIVTILNPEWGDIGGFLIDQTDLQDELNTKAEKIPTEAHIALVEEHIDWTIGGVELIDVTRLPPAASSDAHYVHNQTAAVLVWTIVHNLGKFPAVTTTDINGNEFHGTVDHVDNNNLTVNFSIAISGIAYLN